MRAGTRRAGVLPTAPHRPKGLRYTSAVLFGRCGSGKTYMMSRVPGLLAVDLEGGTRMIEATAVEPRSWAELAGVIDALETEAHEFQAVSIDTVDRAWAFCEQSVCQELGVSTVGDAAHGKGWALLKARWSSFVYRVVNLKAADGRKILPFFLAHEKLSPMTERRNGTAIDTGRSLVSVNLPNTGKLPLLSAVDFIFHLHIDSDDGNRYLLTQATDTPEFRVEAKGRGTPGRCLPPKLPATFTALARAFRDTFSEENTGND